MSKELEALNNIVKEINAYKLHGLGDKNWMGVQDIMQDIRIIERALNELKRLKRVEKLLELYKELRNVKNGIISLVLNDDDYYNMEEIEIDLEKRIKEIENERF